MLGVTKTQKGAFDVSVKEGAVGGGMQFCHLPSHGGDGSDCGRQKQVHGGRSDWRRRSNYSSSQRRGTQIEFEGECCETRSCHEEGRQGNYGRRGSLQTRWEALHDGDFGALPRPFRSTIPGGSEI